MNSFTLEASFNGYIDQNRNTVEFVTKHFIDMGRIVGETVSQYLDMLEEDRVQRLKKLELKR